MFLHHLEGGFSDIYEHRMAECLCTNVEVIWENVCTYVCVCLTAGLCVIWETLGGSDLQRDSRASPPSSMQRHNWDRMAGSTETQLEGEAGFRENFRSALHFNSWTPCRYTASMSHFHIWCAQSLDLQIYKSKQFDGTTTKLHHSRNKQNCLV